MSIPARRGTFPTYIPEIDQKILLDTDDANLFRACNIDPYVQSICDDEVFWRNRTLARYAKLVKFRKGTTWKAFYRRLVNDAMYIVDTATAKAFVYSNIVDAYNALWTEISNSLRATREEILARPVVEGEIMTGFIKLVYKGEVSAVDDEYLLYDNRKPAADILEYPELPALDVKGRQLFYYSGTRFKHVLDLQGRRTLNEYDKTPHNEFRGVFDYTDEVMHSFLTYVPPYAPDYPHDYANNFHILTMDSGNYSLRFVPFKYGYRTKTTIIDEADGSTKTTVTVLVDTSLFGKSLGFEPFQQEIDHAYISRKQLRDIEKIIEQYYSEQ